MNTPSGPLRTLLNLALKCVEGCCIGSVAVPFGFHEVRGASVLERSVNLFSDNSEAPAGIHPPCIEEADQELLKRVSPSMWGHAVQRNEVGFKLRHQYGTWANWLIM